MKEWEQSFYCISENKMKDYYTQIFTKLSEIDTPPQSDLRDKEFISTHVPNKYSSKRIDGRKHDDAIKEMVAQAQMESMEQGGGARINSRNYSKKNRKSSKHKKRKKQSKRRKRTKRKKKSKRKRR